MRSNLFGELDAIVDPEGPDRISAQAPTEFASEENRSIADTTVGNIDKAQKNMAVLFDHVMALYTGGDSSSVSAAEAYELVRSICYVMGARNLDSIDGVRVLAQDDIVVLFRERCEYLREKAEEAMVLWSDLNETMPPIRNISFRDTMLSLGSFKARYDVLFAAHEVPCDIDYQLSDPVSDDYQGVDYVREWLEQALREARYLAQFDLDEIVGILEASCPDYTGLHVNIFDLVYRVKGDI